MGTIVVLDPIDLCSMSKHLFPKKYLLLCSTEGMSEKMPLTLRNITNQSFVFLRAWQYMWPLEDTTTPLRLWHAHSMASVGCYKHSFMLYWKQGEKISSPSKKDPAAPVHLTSRSQLPMWTHQLFLSQKTTGLKALALNLRHSPYDWVPFATLVRKKRHKSHTCCAKQLLPERLHKHVTNYTNRKVGGNICSHMPNAEREEVALRFLTQAC